MSEMMPRDSPNGDFDTYLGPRQTMKMKLAVQKLGLDPSPLVDALEHELYPGMQLERSEEEDIMFEAIRAATALNSQKAGTFTTYLGTTGNILLAR
jgi:hypothetical protein